MQKHFLVLAVLAVVLAAGCIGQERPVRVVSNDGLQIVDFIAEPPSVDIGDPVTFTLQVENVGGTKARNVQVLLQNVEGQWRELDGRTALPTVKQLRDLDPPNPDFNQPGDFDIEYWILRTPHLAQGLVYPADVTAELLYNYNTSGALKIRAIGETFYETEYIAKGKTAPGPEVYNTYAPVQIQVPESRAGQFIIVDDEVTDPQVQTFPIIIELVNVGSGFPVTDGNPGAVYGTIKVSGPGNPEWEECLGNSGTNEAAISPGTLGSEIAKLKATRGKATIACTVALEKDAFVLQDESLRLDFFLEYRYYTQFPIIVRISSYT